MWQMLGQASPRRFFIAWTQSAVGTGAGYVALLLLAYQTFHSPWAVAAILLAEHLPCMLLGPVLGAVVDRVPRRTAAIAADLIGCAAFLGLALAASFPVVLGLALLAGVGVALAQPAAMAGLPEVVEPEYLPAATSLHTGIEEAGVVIGPLVAALVARRSRPSALMLAERVELWPVRASCSQACASLREQQPPGRRPIPSGRSLRPSTRTGLRALRGMLGVAPWSSPRPSPSSPTGCSTSPSCCSRVTSSVSAKPASRCWSARCPRGDGRRLAGALARRPRVVARVPVGPRPHGRHDARRRRRHSVAFALPMLLLCGYGNGITIVHERLPLQHIVPAALHRRVFGPAHARELFLCGSYCWAARSPPPPGRGCCSSSPAPACCARSPGAS